PHVREPDDRARAQRRRGERKLRRGRDRQGTRRLPARRARVLRDPPRLPRRLCGAAGPDGAMTAQAATLAGAPVTGTRPLPQLRGDLAMVADLIEPGSRVLDVGCGEGELLAHLARAKDVDGRGIELSQSGVNA